MIIELLGLSGVKIQSKDTILLLSPSNTISGRMKADCVVLSSPEDKINVEARGEKLFVIDSPGEYEQSGIFVYCSQNPQKGKPESLMSLIKIEGISLAHLSNISHKLDDKDIELFEGSDVLMVPVGGRDVIDAKVAKEIVEIIEPRIVIPMHFAQKGAKSAYDDPSKFFKEIGIAPEAQDKIKITKSDLPQDTMEAVYLSI